MAAFTSGMTVAQFYVLLRANTAQYHSALERASLAQVKWVQKAQVMGRALTYSLSLPLAIVGGAAVKTAMDFDKSMTKIRALVGLQAAEMQNLGKEIESISRSTAQSQNELAEAAYFIASSGYDSFKKGAAGLDILQASADAAVAGMGEAQTTADLVTSAMNAYGAENLKAGRAMDILTSAIREGKTEPEEFARAIGRGLDQAQAAGVEFEELSATIASMSLSGVSAFRATTAFIAVLRDLQKPSKAGEEALSGIGLSVDQVNESLRGDFLGTLKDLKERFGDNNSAMRDLFKNTVSYNLLLSLTGEKSGQVSKLFDKVAGSAGDFNDAVAIAKQQEVYKFEQAMTNLKTSLMDLGHALYGPVGAGAKVLQKFSTAFSSLSDEGKKLVGTFGLLLALAGPVLLVAAKIRLAYLSMFGSMSAEAIAHSQIEAWAAAETAAAHQAAATAISQGYTKAWAEAIAAARAGTVAMEAEALKTAATTAAAANIAPAVPGAWGSGFGAARAGSFSAKVTRTITRLSPKLGRFMGGSMGIAAGLAFANAFVVKEGIWDPLVSNAEKRFRSLGGVGAVSFMKGFQITVEDLSGGIREWWRDVLPFIDSEGEREAVQSASSTVKLVQAQIKAALSRTSSQYEGMEFKEFEARVQELVKDLTDPAQILAIRAMLAEAEDQWVYYAEAADGGTEANLKAKKSFGELSDFMQMFSDKGVGDARKAFKEWADEVSDGITDMSGAMGEAMGMHEAPSTKLGRVFTRRARDTAAFLNNARQLMGVLSPEAMKDLISQGLADPAGGRHFTEHLLGDAKLLSKVNTAYAAVAQARDQFMPALRKYAFSKENVKDLKEGKNALKDLTQVVDGFQGAIKKASSNMDGWAQAGQAIPEVVDPMITSFQDLKEAIKAAGKALQNFFGGGQSGGWTSPWGSGVGGAGMSGGGPIHGLKGIRSYAQGVAGQTGGGLSSVKFGQVAQSNWYAQMNPDGTMIINQKYKGDLGSLIKSYRADQRSGYHPDKANPLRSLAAHEVGHLAGNRLENAGKSGQLMAFLGKKLGLGGALSLSNHKALIESQVSRYATGDMGEFIAEALSDAWAGRDPSKMSKLVARFVAKNNLGGSMAGAVQGSGGRKRGGDGGNITIHINAQGSNLSKAQIRQAAQDGMAEALYQQGRVARARGR